MPYPQGRRVAASTYAVCCPPAGTGETERESTGDNEATRQTADVAHGPGEVLPPGGARDAATKGMQRKAPQDARTLDACAVYRGKPHPVGAVGIKQRHPLEHTK